MLHSTTSNTFTGILGINIPWLGKSKLSAPSTWNSYTISQDNVHSSEFNMANLTINSK